MAYANEGEGATSTLLNSKSTNVNGVETNYGDMSIPGWTDLQDVYCAPLAAGEGEISNTVERALFSP